MKKIVLMLMVVAIAMTSCTKESSLATTQRSKAYFRIQEVATTGTTTLSTISVVVVE